MVNESNHAGDSAGVTVPTHHELLATGHLTGARYLRPFEHFGHSLEELLDLNRTPHHGGDPVVSPESLVSAVQPAKNAIRVQVRNAQGELKQLIIDHNCRSNSGGNWLNILMGGDVNANIGYENHSGAVAYTATTITPTVSPGWTVNQWAGHYVVVPLTTGTTPTLIAAKIISNTAPALTVDQFQTITSTSGAAGSTPAANCSFAILDGQAPARWIAMSTDTGTEDIGNTTLTGEFTANFTAAGRWFGTYSQTTAPTGTGTTNSNAIYKLDTGVLTANGTVTVAKLGLFQFQNGGNLMFVKKLGTAASVISGDTLDGSWSITDA